MPTNSYYDVVTLSDPNIITTQQDIVVPKQVTRCGFKCHLDKASNKMTTHYDKKSLYPTVYTMWAPYVVLFRQPKKIWWLIITTQNIITFIRVTQCGQPVWYFVRACVVLFIHKFPTIYMMWAQGVLCYLELPQTKWPIATQNKQDILFGRVNRINHETRYCVLKQIIFVFLPWQT